MRNLIRKPADTQADRGGAVTVEFALTVPVLFLLVFAQLEFARANMIRHAIKTACYEGTRVGIVPGATAADVEDAAEFVLNAVSLTDFDLTVEPSVITSDTTSVTVTIDVPVAENSWLIPTFLNGTVLSNSMTLDRERVDLVMF